MKSMKILYMGARFSSPVVADQVELPICSCNIFLFTFLSWLNGCTRSLSVSVKLSMMSSAVGVVSSSHWNRIILYCTMMRSADVNQVNLSLASRLLMVTLSPTLLESDDPCGIADRSVIGLAFHALIVYDKLLSHFFFSANCSTPLLIVASDAPTLLLSALL